jgi:hypothetical protein
MSDGANDALRSYIRAGMPLDRTVGKACPHCGRWSYTRNKCHPKQNLFCAGSAGNCTTTNTTLDEQESAA